LIGVPGRDLTRPSARSAALPFGDVTPAIFQSIGPVELLIVLGVVLVIFGPKRLPALGRQLGAGMREFRDSIRGRDDATDDDAPPTLRPGDERAADGEVVSERR
jgi:sec-independent protein translocase protein TatA